MMQWHNHLARGYISHQRHEPVTHGFCYPLCMALIDLDQSENLNRLPFWSTNRFNLIQFRRSDYLGDNRLSIKEAVKNQLLAANETRIPEKVYILTNPRNWGYCFNPVSFYFCMDKEDKLFAVVSEINNTPWNERFCYVNSIEEKDKGYSSWSFSFPKQFHVSPFMEMNLHYHWKFSISEQRIRIHMGLDKNGDRIFDSLMNVELIELTQRSALIFPMQYAFNTVRTTLRIYWQALLLYIKKVPFITHPEKQPSKSRGES